MNRIEIKRVFVGVAALALAIGACNPAVETEGGELGEATSALCERASAPQMLDATAPDTAARLANKALVSVGDPVVRYRADGTKEVSQKVLVDGDLKLPGTLTCTSSCNGNFCSGSGCDPFGETCSTYSCSQGCSGSCTKTVTVEIN